MLDMPAVITELEKTILLSFLIMARGNAKKVLREEDITLKFPAKQRKMVRRHISRLAKYRLLMKTNSGYQLTNIGLKEATKTLSEGATFV